MQASFHRSITNELHDLEKLMNASTNFLEDREVDAQAVYRINLALEEMISNVIRHGYDDYESHEIQVSIEVGENEVTAIIEDDGHEFNPLKQEGEANPVSLEKSKIGGRGIQVIKKLLDHVDYRRENGKNILTIQARRQF
ncbi:MAG: ATP-binding protein [Methylacidiphilales bacterium]|nr:ATP-binding protein [Candidatus Methylacidiphilales bacterium]